VWGRTVEGRPLRFRLSGINNQNFIMRDEETGTWWQQVTGSALHGPLKGRRLPDVFHDELTFALWRREHPAGRVLRPDAANDRWIKFSEDWEAKTARAPVVTQQDALDALAPRDIVVGLKAGGEARAYPLSAVERQSPIVDRLGGAHVLVLLGDDRKSVRAFEATVDGRELEFFVKPDSAPLEMVDAETGTTWNFTGRATAGPLAGRALRKLPALKDYWFDWKLYNPQTTVYTLGSR
jgi:Protein of unknown function (DUF3179)